MIHNRARGSVVGYAIVGVLLLGAATGAIYTVKRGITGIGSPSSGSAVNETDAQTVNNDEKTNDKVANQSETSSSDELAQALKDQAAAEEKAKQQNEAVEGSKNATTSQSGAQALADKKGTAPVPTIPTTGVQASSSEVASHLPQTGPAENAASSLIGLALIVATAIAYRRSRALV